MSKHSIKLRIYILPVILATFILSCGFDQTVSDAVSNTINPPKKDVIPKALIANGSRTVSVNASVTLDGTPSFDPQQEKITHAWTLVAPNGSSAAIGSATATVTSFITDKGGFYTVTLQVTNESGEASEIKTIVIDAVGAGSNHPPVAMAGADASVTIATTGVALLDGSASYDADGDTLSYQWLLLGAPSAATGSPGSSTYQLFESKSDTAQLYPYIAGIYTLQLTVSDGIDQDQDQVVITAE
ncbi:hypothetical protein MNBD_NITROSPINAE03-296 [hydrothermal vent metagenome]|uniref:PKD/Chitinase domain-containing protein n=1 Tax=hydrothermal vent metagenome TaxID=652676 RepID=A0A3B1C385_9ZZZZ